MCASTTEASPWLFCTIELNREKGDWCCEWLDDLRHKHHILHELPCFYVLQETDHWTTSARNVPGYSVYGTDHGRTDILCPWEVNHFRRSWVDNERCTAILVGSTMLLSVYMPHSGRDEVDYIEPPELVRATLMEGKRMGAVDFFIGGDLNIELKLCFAGDEHRGLDSIEWYGMYGPECEGSAEDIIAYGKKFRWFRLLKDFNCTVTSTWSNNEDSREFHTCGHGDHGVVRSSLTIIMGPKNLRSVTWRGSALGTTFL